MLQLPAASGSADAAPITAGDYLEFWLSHIRGRVRARTHQGYAGMIKLYAKPRIGDRTLADLRPLDLQGLYADLLGRGLSGGTVLNLHLVLTQALSQAAKWGLVPASPAEGAQPPRPRRPEPLMVDPALARRVLQATHGTFFECLVAMAIATGMRRGELLALRWTDLDERYTVAHVRRSLQTAGRRLLFEEPKTKRSRRSVALPAFVLPYLRRHRAAQEAGYRLHPPALDAGLVFARADGRPLNPDTMSARWKGFLRRVGLPSIRFHDLRHAHATLMLLQGVHPKVVSERLGHASVGITLDTYSHVLPILQTEAARAFDELFGTAPAPAGLLAG